MDANKVYGNTNKTYADIAAQGIEEYLKGKFLGSQYDFVLV